MSGDQGQEVEITPEMISAGVEAYWAWDQFTERASEFWDDPVQRERLDESAMVREVLKAVFGGHCRFRNLVSSAS